MLNFSKINSQFYLITAIFLASCSAPVPESDSTTSTNTDTNLDVTPTDNLQDPYVYLNNLRKSAGMISLSKNAILERSSANHATYLVKNNTSGHTETVGKLGFSGISTGDRAVAAGYNSYVVGEGIATAVHSIDALDNLMSAIYHRFTLLDFEYNEIGMSIDGSGNNSTFVHNMANSRVDDLCQSSVSVNTGRFYRNICEPEIQLNASDFEAANTFVVNQNPEYVLWPPANGTDILPAFFEETPDPLPDYSVSGYPISIQFNAQKTADIIVADFRLFDIATQSYVTNTRLLDEQTDPNKSFSTLEYSLFPLDRLQWAADYRVELEYSEQGNNKTLSWEFKTRSPGGEVKEIKTTDTNINIQSGVKSYLYFVPQNGTDLIRGISSSFPLGTEVRIDFTDQNTLAVIINGKAGDKVTLVLNGKRELSITIS